MTAPTTPNPRDAATHDAALATPELLALDQMATRPSTLAMSPRVTYLGGPTYLIEIGQFRIVTDPGFDPQGTERSEGTGHVLTKVMAPPIPVDKVGPVDRAVGRSRASSKRPDCPTRWSYCGRASRATSRCRCRPERANPRYRYRGARS